MADRFQDKIGGLEAPYREAFAVTPDNDTDLALATRGVYIGGAGSGNLKVDMIGSGTVTFAGLTANTILPIRVTRIYATGTDVTAIIGLV